MTDTVAARLCAKLIKKGIAKGVRLRPGRYSRDFDGHVEACAIGSIEHALQRGRAVGISLDGDQMVADIKEHTGLTRRQLRTMEGGFEGPVKFRASNPLRLLGRRLRANFIKRLPASERLDWS